MLNGSNYISIIGIRKRCAKSNMSSRIQFGSQRYSSFVVAEPNACMNLPQCRSDSLKALYLIAVKRVGAFINSGHKLLQEAPSYISTHQ